MRFYCSRSSLLLSSQSRLRLPLQVKGFRSSATGANLAASQGTYVGLINHRDEKMRFNAAALSTLGLGRFVLLSTSTSAFGTSSFWSVHRAAAVRRSFALSRLFSSSADEEKMEESKKDQTFPTWSFDGPCKSMEWSTLVDVGLFVVTGAAAEKAMEADLILIGIQAPFKQEAEEDDEEKNDDEGKKEEPPVELTGVAKDLEQALGGDGILSGLVAENNKAFKNGVKAGSTTPGTRIATAGGGKAKRVVFVGLGQASADGKDEDQKEKKKKDEETLGKSIGKAVASAVQNQKKVETCAVVLPESISASLDSAFYQDFSATFYQTLYADNRYKSKSKQKKIVEDLKAVQLLVEGGASMSDADATASITKGRQLATGIFLTKDIVNAPHNVLNSESLAETARRVASYSTDGCITCQILDKTECEKRGMGAFLGVARGSETEPQFIHLTYKPPGSGESPKKKVAVVGKGLLFDTGGYNIKTQLMSLMKFDCGGAAAVLGAARAIGAMQPEGVEVHFIVAACENMINQKAIVPSDILTASNGKTIEVLNTDAEGRLTLADALVFADKEVGAERIIELSTLTGACMVSLGMKVAGVWTANDDLASELEEVSKVTGDKSWRMPLVKEYEEEMTNSLSADLKNIGGKYGGAITAALFLQHFVSKKKPFAHIDIAGPVWSEKTGATGYGAQLVVEWVRRQGL